jgi:hypothetical protein
VYVRAQELAQDLLVVLDHPDTTGIIRYHDEDEKKVCVEIFSKKDRLSQGTCVFTVTHESGRVEVWTKSIPDDVYVLLESFAQDTNSQLLL